ncbi:MAG: nuclear transport factor 2 family protein [Actinomycetota bacterium]|jgi:3-phenylpropionate/cinnamic acid dioxygenase small subunit|uniref:nuclear transport factor 2 family protein n=1 Tax=uncultured Ilumatobacter sp. TaxID=879968 RepID=UPI00374F8625|nr:nuclear transport factor 2 family protein [Actinomycetota bacterium]
MSISTDDRLELHELPGRYGDAIDDRDWPALDRIFTTDAVFDMTDLGIDPLVGLAGTASYYDQVVQTDDGWRVQHRVVTLRRR